MNNIEEQYRKLADQWNQETGYLSNLGKAVRFPSFRAIIELGWPVVPLLLLDMKQEPNHLSNLALAEITGEYPVPDEARGQVSEMAKAWIAWGQHRRLID